jgi:hypothetical protein
MTKAQMAEWLLRRISTKVDDLRYAEGEEIAGMLADDVDIYLGVLKDVLIEVVKP